MSKQEEKDRKTGILTSVGIHAGLFLALFFMVAWKAPNPPLPEFGVELNFGMDDQGGGDVQPETPVGDKTEQQTDEIQEKSAETQPEEVKTDVKEEVKNLPETAAEKVVSKEVSDVAVKEEKKEVKTEVKDKPKETVPKEKVVAEYKKEVVPTDGTKKGDPGSQGDDAKKVGDKGSPEGKLDAKALYGTPGGGGGGDGTGLQMTGWAWAEELKIPELPDTENGKVTFEIECDQDGEIIGITTRERSLSAKSEQILKDQIRKNSLIRTSNAPAPDRSRGKFTFILKTK